MYKHPMNAPITYQRVGLKMSKSEKNPNIIKRVEGATTLTLNNVPNNQVI